MNNDYYLALAEWLLVQPITANREELAQQLQDFEDGFFSRPEAFDKEAQ